jgi:hypothetical protein
MNPTEGILDTKLRNLCSAQFIFIRPFRVYTKIIDERLNEILSREKNKKIKNHPQTYCEAQEL